MFVKARVQQMPPYEGNVHKVCQQLHCDQRHHFNMGVSQLISNPEATAIIIPDHLFLQGIGQVVVDLRLNQVQPQLCCCIAVMLSSQPDS